MDEIELLKRITFNEKIFGGKPIIRNHRLAVEHVLGMLVAGDTAQDIIKAYPWIEDEDIKACLLFARKIVAHERVDIFPAHEAAP